MAGFYICAGMQLWKGSEYSKIPCMPSFCVSSIAQGSEYAWSTFHRVLKKPPTQSWPFFPKSGHFFRFSKSRGGFPSICVPVSVPEYASISLNMNTYYWRRLHKLFWLCQDFEYAWSSYMFDRLLKIPRVLNKPRFRIWYGCICKDYREFRICLTMALYASITPENASICLNIPQYA